GRGARRHRPRDRRACAHASPGSARSDSEQPADAITRSELQAAIAAAQPQHVAAADGEQPKQVDDSVHALAIELVRGVRTNESPHAAPVVAVRGANIPAVDAGASISAKAVEHLLRVYG